MRIIDILNKAKSDTKVINKFGDAIKNILHSSNADWERKAKESNDEIVICLYKEYVILKTTYEEWCKQEWHYSEPTELNVNDQEQCNYETDISTDCNAEGDNNGENIEKAN